jgi:hypothetical protein
MVNLISSLRTPLELRVAAKHPNPNTGLSKPATASPKAVTANSPAPAAATSSSSQVPDFRDLFTGKTTPVVPQQPNTPPTAESVFGANPWISNPTGIGPNGIAFGYNRYYFATPQTAAKVADMVGGTVVQSNCFTPNGGAFSQQQPNLMVKLPDGRMINPGLVASFYTNGWPQSYIDQMIAAEVRNA